MSNIKEVVEPVKKPHKHAELIKAWADGAEIEYRFQLGFGENQPWSKWRSTTNETIAWAETDFCDYRIKPQPKPDVVETLNVTKNNIYKDLSERANLKLIWDGETGELKSAEVISHEDALKGESC